MTWEVVFHPLVLKVDLPAVDAAARRAILKAIRKKLSTAPESYGEPLRKELFGYWKLRVGDYRVIFEIQKNFVRILVLKIGMRRDSQVYSEMLSRLKKLP